MFHKTHLCYPRCRLHWCMQERQPTEAALSLCSGIDEEPHSSLAWLTQRSERWEERREEARGDPEAGESRWREVLQM